MRFFLPLLLSQLMTLSSVATAESVASRNGAIRFLAFGDSNTVGHGDTGVRCPDNTSVGGYPPRLRTRLATRGIDAEFQNFGLCGESTSAGLTRIDSVLAEGGDVIVIMQGTIDVAQGMSMETALFNLNEMARKAEAAGVEPLLASVIPRGPESGRDTDNVITGTIAVRLRADAAAAGRAFADPFHAFFDLPDFFERFYFDQTHPKPVGYGIMADAMIDAAVDAATRHDLCAQASPGPCVAGDTVLCLNQNRFRLEVMWENFFGQTGAGHAVPQTADTGAFYWVDPQNIELIIKVLDGREHNGFFWVFYGALSNLDFTIAVTDTENGECKEYRNPLGTFASVGDTAAFFDGDFSSH